MSLTRRVWIDKDPAYADVRRRAAREASDYVAQFPFRIQGSKRNPEGSRPYHDPFWPGALNQAASELRVETANINGGKFFRNEAERDAVRDLAEKVWRERREAFQARRAQL